MIKHLLSEGGMKEERKLRGDIILKDFSIKKIKHVPIKYVYILKLKEENELDQIITKMGGGIKQITTSFLWDNPEWFEKKGYAKVKKYDVVVDLDRKELEIFNSFDRSVKKNIRKNDRRFKLEVESRDDWETLKKFYRLLNRSRKRLKLSEYSLNWFKIIFKNFFLKRRGSLYCTFKNQKMLSGLLVIYNEFYGMEIMSANEDFKMNSNDLIKWKVIKDLKNLGLKYYNLTGVAPNQNNKKLDSVYRFKRKFGEVKKFHTYVKPKVLKFFIKT